METQLHTIKFAGNKDPPNRAKLELRVGSMPGTMNVRVQLPHQEGWTDFQNLPIVDRTLVIPVTLAFLCHAKEDKAAAGETAARLLRDGHMIWFDELDLLAGADWEREIEAAIDRSDYVITFLSHNSCSKTGFVQREIRHALEQQQRRPVGSRFVIPILIDDVIPPREFWKFHWLRMDDESWYEQLKQALQLNAPH